MAIVKGSAGVVKAGTTVIEELTGWQFDETCDTIETTRMGDVAKTFTSGKTSWTGSAEAEFSTTDAGQSALTNGAELTVKFYPSGDSVAGREGDITITSVSTSAEAEGLVTVSFSFQGSGVLRPAAAA